MSFLGQNQLEARSEATTLLGDSRPYSQPTRSLSRERSGFSHETLLIPVALATKLAAQIPSTTIVELVRKAVCRLWIESHGDPATLGPGGLGPPELCDAPEIARYFSTVIAILGTTGGIICMSVLLSTAAVIHKHSSDCRVWHIKPYFIALREETGVLTLAYRWDHGKFHGNWVTVHA